MIVLRFRYSENSGVESLESSLTSINIMPKMTDITTSPLATAVEEPVIVGAATELEVSLSAPDHSRVIEMAWEDRTTFEAIEFQFGLSEAEVIALMRSELRSCSFRAWRKRVSGRRTKHGSTSRSDRFRAACHK